jgi:hypothetical protein
MVWRLLSPSAAHRDPWCNGISASDGGRFCGHGGQIEVRFDDSLIGGAFCGERWRSWPLGDVRHELAASSSVGCRPHFLAVALVTQWPGWCDMGWHGGPPLVRCAVRHVHGGLHGGGCGGRTTSTACEARVELQEW